MRDVSYLIMLTLASPLSSGRSQHLDSWRLRTSCTYRRQKIHTAETGHLQQSQHHARRPYTFIHADGSGPHLERSGSAFLIFFCRLARSNSVLSPVSDLANEINPIRGSLSCCVRRKHIRVGRGVLAGALSEQEYVCMLGPAWSLHISIVL